VLRVKLPHLTGWTAGRQRNAQRYAALFDRAGLTGIVTLPAKSADSSHIYNQFVIRVPERDRLREHLQANGVGTEVYYPVPLHLQPCFRELGYPQGAFPAAEAVARETLALPIYGELTEEQQAWVVESIRNFFHTRA
jgi:dTDP-4-amino-4,6-dideoxygalactose transaminase